MLLKYHTYKRYKINSYVLKNLKNNAAELEIQAIANVKCIYVFIHSSVHMFM